jgi:hypothetical protein
MALVLTEEQSMLRDSARGLISDKAPVSHLRQLRDSKDATGFSRDLWKFFAEMGFTGLLVPEEFGGSGLGCVEAGVVMEEIGRTLMPSPFLSTAVLGASALSRGGSAAQKAEYLPKISAGSLLTALAVDEGAKHRPLQTAMQAVRDVGPGGHYLGHPHTLENFERAFFMPKLFDNNSIEQWQAEGSVEITARALDYAKKLLGEYEEPKLDAGIDDALRDYIARREREIPAVDELNTEY